MGLPSYLSGLCVTQDNWQDFGEWKLEGSKKLVIKTCLILSLLKSTPNATTTASQIWTRSFGEINLSTVVKLNIVLFSVLFCFVL